MLKYMGLHDAPCVRVKFRGRYSVSSTPQNEIYRCSPNFNRIAIIQRWLEPIIYAHIYGLPRRLIFPRSISG